jgi:hypothetical protein
VRGGARGIFPEFIGALEPLSCIAKYKIVCAILKKDLAS